MSKRNEANWTERLRALGCRGKLPAALTDAVVEAARHRPLGERYVLPDGEVPGLELRVGATGGATFLLWYRTKTGVRRHQKIGAAGAVALDEARARARKLLVKVEDGQDPLAAAKVEAERQRTVRSFLEEVHAPKVLAKRRDGEATKVRMLAVWAPLLDVPLVHLTRDKIDEVLTARKVKPATMRRIWNPFRRMLREADEREALPADLARKLLRRPEALIGLTPDEPRERWLGDRDEGEPARFEAALAVFTSGEPGGGDFLRTACALALATGMRRGEIVRLTDTMANLKERTISLPASITKGNKPRTIDLHDKAVAAITLWREVRKALKVQSVDGALFPGDPVHWERRLTAWNRDFHHLCEQAGIVDLHFHDLRHDFGVRFLHAGGTMEQLQKVLGHASIVTTAKHYGHAIPKDVRRAVLAM